MAGNQNVWGSTASGAGTGASIGGSVGGPVGAGWGAAIGGGVGLLSGLLGGGGGTDTSGAMKHLYDSRILDTISKYFPELQSLRSDSSMGGLLPMLQGHTNQGYLNASGSLNDIFARNGMLGSGLQGGSNASLQLARGSQLNADQIQALQFLLPQILQSSQFAEGLGEARSGILTGANRVPSAANQGILGALQGAGYGALNGQWNQNQNRDYGNVNLGNSNNATFTPTNNQGNWNWWNQQPSSGHMGF